MLFLLIHNIVAMTGELIPEDKPSMRLAEVRKNKVVFADMSTLKDVKNAGLVEYDDTKQTLKVNGQELCTSNVGGLTKVTACRNGYSASKWAPYGENGMYKFSTDSDLCLTLGPTKDGFNAVLALKCRDNLQTQRFTYDKGDGKKENTAEYEVEDANKLRSILNKYPSTEKISITLPDDDKENKTLRTKVGVLNDLMSLNRNGNNIDHDTIVDTTANTHKLIEDN